jgi:hypothetical protein
MRFARYLACMPQASLRRRRERWRAVAAQLDRLPVTPQVCTIIVVGGNGYISVIGVAVSVVDVNVVVVVCGFDGAYGDWGW